MLSGGLACEDSLAGQALTHVLIEDIEHLADSIGANGCSEGIVLQQANLRHGSFAARQHRQGTCVGVCFSITRGVTCKIALQEQPDLGHRSASSCICWTIARKSRIVATRLDRSASSRQLPETTKVSNSCSSHAHGGLQPRGYRRSRRRSCSRHCLSSRWTRL